MIKVIDDKKYLIEVLKDELAVKEEDGEYCSIFPSAELDLQDEDKALLKYKYVVFFDTYFNEGWKAPEPAHWVPIDNEFNSLVTSYLGI